MTASTPTTVTTTPTLKRQTPPPVTYTIWWSNATFFVAVHILAALGAYYYPWYTVNRASLILCFLTWQAACFSITIGYHRLYSHKTFKAAFPVRVLLAALGASAFQGSIKWWALRHRLHHRFEDDPQHDPYCATEGMLWAHVGWIFYKRNYEKLEVIEKHDLESDIVVRTQHKYYLPFAILAGFVFPIVMGMLWNDPVGSFIWAGLVSKIMIWHCTFMVNSLAHWNGLQPYSDDTTSVSNLICAVLTCGEGNHNFHAFPYDFRAGTSHFTWDPSKWIIVALRELGLVWSLKTARDEDVRRASKHMKEKAVDENFNQDSFISKDDERLDSNLFGKGDGSKNLKDAPVWNDEDLFEYVRDASNDVQEEKKGKKKCVLVVDDWVLDCTEYLGEHPGGSSLIRQYAVPIDASLDGKDSLKWKEATWAFMGGFNRHSRNAKRIARDLVVAKLSS